MVSYELAKELKDAMFPFRTAYGKEGSYPVNGFVEKGIDYFSPTLSELIDACGQEFYSLVRMGSDGFRAFSTVDAANTIATKTAPTAEEAVARLWLALQTKAKLVHI